MLLAGGAGSGCLLTCTGTGSTPTYLSIRASTDKSEYLEYRPLLTVVDDGRVCRTLCKFWKWKWRLRRELQTLRAFGGHESLSKAE
eukprot:2919710-Rhodomonas_salina.1